MIWDDIITGARGDSRAIYWLHITCVPSELQSIPWVFVIVKDNDDNNDDYDKYERKKEEQ